MEIVYLVTLAYVFLILSEYFRPVLELEAKKIHSRLIKCSILAFYRRIVAQKKHRLFIYIVAFVIILQSFINLLVSSQVPLMARHALKA